MNDKTSYRIGKNPKSFLTKNELEYIKKNVRPNVSYFSVWRKDSEDPEGFSRYVFAYKKRKIDKEVLIGLALAENSSHYIVSLDLEYVPMSGYLYTFKNEKKKRNGGCYFGYGIAEHDGRLIERDRYSCNMFAPLIGRSRLLSFIKTKHPHFSLPQSVRDPFEQLDIWCKYPTDCERLCIMGFFWLVPTIRSYEIIKDSNKRKAIASFMKNRRAQIISLRASWAQIRDCVRLSCGFGDLERLSETEACRKVLAMNGALQSFSAEARKWLKNKLNGFGRWSLSEWTSYLSDCKNSGMDMNNPSVLMPRDFREAVSHASMLADEKEKSAIDSKIKKISEILGKMKVGKFLVAPMSSVADFVNTGKIMKMCVGQYGYDKKMAEGRTFCAVFYVAGKPKECVEIDFKTKGIIQLYGKNDRPTEYHKKAIELCTSFATSINGDQMKRVRTLS